MQSLCSKTLFDLPRNELLELLKWNESPLSLLACVSRQFNKLVGDFALRHPPKGSFDRAMWVAYGADPEAEPPMMALPLPVYDRCVAGQYMCTFVPEYFEKERPLSSTYLHHFVRKLHARESSIDDELLLDERVGRLKGHWCIVACSVLEENGGKESTKQKELVEAAGFRIPRLLDVIVSLLMHSLLRGGNLFQSSAPGIRGTFTIVRETASEDILLAVGCGRLKGALHFRPCSTKSDFGSAYSLSSLDSA